MHKPLRKKRLLNLIQKYLDGSASGQERSFVEKYFDHFDLRSGPPDGLSEIKRRQLEQRMLDKIHVGIRSTGGTKTPRFRGMIWMQAAAAILLLIVTGTLAYDHFFHHAVSPPVAVSQPDIGPGTNGAVLQLSSGKSIVLDSLGNGRLAIHAANIISKTDSTVSFAAARSQSSVEYYTLITPRARQQQIVLSDGTRVWLNAGSSIRFPSAFLNGRRSVEVTGEAYFEVAKDDSDPFFVQVKDIRIEVLGTHFNVMAYRDEPVSTTLLEGAVKVVKGGASLLLNPGQQALIDEQGRMRLVRDVNLYETVAWKNNLFWFENDDVRTVMTRLSRWYNVDIQIEGDIPDLFTGSIPRDLPFSKVFEVLQKTGSIHYILKNHQIIVSP